MTSRVTATSLFSAAILPMAYTAAYQEIPVTAPAPVVEAQSVPTWTEDEAEVFVPPAQPLQPAVDKTPGTTRNRYAYGNCTYYVASKRAIPRGWGHARTWKQRAEASGYKTGSVPAVGAVAWTPFGRYGHVAYVESVAGDTVTISEMNYIRWNRISTRIVPASSFQYIY